MRYLTAIAALALAGCVSIPAPTDMGETCIRTFAWHRTENAWRTYADLHRAPLNPWLNGFIFEHDGVCHVYAPDPPLGPGRTYRPGQWGTLGHEIKHCCDGAFHAPAR